MAKRFDGKLVTVANSVHNSHSRWGRELNCTKFDELLAILGNPERVWQLLRQVGKAADMSRSLYQVRCKSTNAVSAA